MTTYRIFPSTNGPSTAVTYTGTFISGVCFAVSGGGNWFDGYWWWVAGSNQSTSPVKCALWAFGATNSTSASLVVPGSVVTSGTLTAGAWNYIPLSTPVQLAPGWDKNNSKNGSIYIAAIGCNGNFPDTTGFWGQGGAGSAGISNGPLFAYSCANASGATNQAPYGIAQGVFASSGSTDPSINIPLQASTVDNFWVDVQIDTTAPSNYAGTYRLWPNKMDANPTLSGDAAFNYTVATEIDITSAVTLNNIWYFSPNGATTLATHADVWNISTGLSVASVSSPTWLTASGSTYTAGTNPAGTLGEWVKAAFSGGTSLPAGSYRVSVFNSNGTSDANWSPKDATSDYWGETFTGAGASGITWGPLSAPSWANASSGYLYGGPSSNNPPFSNGTTPHAQPVFGQNGGGTIQFPQLNAPVGASNNQSQNYWVDLEITPATNITGVVSAITVAGNPGSLLEILSGSVSGINVSAKPGLPAITVVSFTETEYNILSQILADAIMEWNIGTPVSGQIRQTSADRTDFAY